MSTMFRYVGAIAVGMVVSAAMLAWVALCAWGFYSLLSALMP
jgi:hypothetical protein